MRRACFLIVALAVLGCEPWGPMPGGQLSGEVAPAAPSDWSFADEYETVQIETRPSDPYSVNLWGAGIGKSFFVAAGDGETADWAQHLLDDPNVRLRVGDTIYELRAMRIQDEAEVARFMTALLRKYEFEPTEEQRRDAWLFRLDPR
jgi:hypothetical protein